jgi:hypothetical protein
MRFFLSARAAAYNFSRPKPDRQHACFEPLHPGVYIGNRRPDRVHPESQFRILITAESNWLVATTDTPGIFQRVAAVRLRPTYCAQYAVSGKTGTFCAPPTRLHQIPWGQLVKWRFFANHSTLASKVPERVGLFRLGLVGLCTDLEKHMVGQMVWVCIEVFINVLGGDDDPCGCIRRFD